MKLDALIEWMNEQLLVDLVETVNEFGRHLDGLGVDALGCKDLVRLSDAAAPFVDKVHAKLAAGFRQAGLPLTGAALEKRRASERLYQLILAIEHARIIEVESARCASEPHAAESYLRCIDWTSRMIRDRYAAYDEIPRDWFLELHGTYARARQRLAPFNTPFKARIHADYVALLLFAIINPYSLVREEMDEMHGCLRRVAGNVKMASTPPSEKSRFIDVTGRVMPHVTLSPKASTAMSSGVFLDVEALMSGEVTDEMPEHCTASMTRFITRLSFHLARRENRDKKKTVEGENHILMVLGFRDIHRHIERLGEQKNPEKVKFALHGLDWGGIDDPGEKARGAESPMVGRQQFRMDIELDEDGVWQNEGRMTAREDLFGAGAKEEKLDPGKFRELGPEQWQLINISSGGYRLRWRFEQHCHAAVDELVLVQDLDENGTTSSPVSLGVIRWVRNQVEQGLDVGVERITGEYEARFGKPVGASSLDVVSVPVLIHFDADGEVDRMIARSRDLRGGEAYKITGIEKPVVAGRIQMVGDGFVVVSAGAMND